MFLNNVGTDRQTEGYLNAAKLYFCRRKPYSDVSLLYAVFIKHAIIHSINLALEWFSARCKPGINYPLVFFCPRTY
jgi:hypothetical protein